ncbi:MAG: glycogen/starch/alpha-glucan phosphorylase, partial [Henriciella sp.]|nr:glycogen/starch/alpha-glucan phosphorylase [Henriciella sp.]
MRSVMLGAVALCLLPAACETSGGGDFGTVLGEVLGSVGTSGSGTQDALSAFEIDAALRQALEIGADRDVFHPVKDKLLKEGITASTDPRLDSLAKAFLTGPDKIPIYSGGLGILAGDTLKSIADLKIPTLAISLFYRAGYFSQLVDSKVGQISWQKEWAPETVPSLYLLQNPEDTEQPLEIEVDFFDTNDLPITAYA